MQDTKGWLRLTRSLHLLSLHNRLRASFVSQSDIEKQNAFSKKKIESGSVLPKALENKH
jgi:hypothetical protein